MPESSNDIRTTLGISMKTEDELRERVKEHFTKAIEENDGLILVGDVLNDFISDESLTKTEIAYVSYQFGRIIMGGESRGHIDDSPNS